LGAAALGLACALSFVVASPAWGAEDPPAAPTTESPEVVFIPVGEIGGRAEAVEALLREIRTELSATGLEERAEVSLPESKAEIAARATELEDLLSGGYRLNELEALEAGWLALDGRLAEQESELTGRATQLDAWLGEIGKQREVWDRTRAAARRASAPQTTLGQVEATLEALASGNRAVERSRNSALALESRVSEQRRSVQAALERISAAAQAVRASFFVRQEEPVWRVRVVEEIREDLGSAGRVLTDAGTGIARYTSRHPDRLIMHALLIAALLWAVRRAQSVLRREPSSVGAPAESAEAGGTPQGALAYPWAAALLLGLSLTRAFHPEAPVEFRVAVTLVAVPPWLRVLGGLLPAALRASLYGLAALLVGSLLYAILAELKLLARLILMAEFAVGLVWLLWLRRPERLHHFPLLLGRNLWLRALDGWLRLSLGAFAIGLGAGLLGYRLLGALVAELVIWGAFLGTVFLAAVRISEALVEAFVNAGWLDRLRMIGTDRELILGVTRRGLRTLGALAWIYILLSGVALWAPVRDAGARMLSARLGYGPATLSLGGLMAFGLTLWISWLVARFVSFILDREMFPRIRLAPGVPFALATFTRYAILVVGFVTALAMLGFALDRVVLLVSALGVGIGFGLQNVVNNFVSGVILLFERPIRMGDRVQLDDLLGVVTSIGIRASKVRTFDGSDVVVPNGDFISARLINWTLSDQKRRIIVPVGVAYGTDPEKVLGILERVARSHPEVLAEPAPELLFRGFGDSSLDFELRAWTESSRGWLPIQSELAVATNRALAEAGIQIPFPQRDLHVRNVSELREAVTDALRAARRQEGQPDE
jgi:small-conductance mechanosensitive channel